jgi:hypothetical protein
MGKLAPLANDAPPSVIFESLAVSSSTHYAASRSSIGESETVQVKVTAFLNVLTLSCKLSNVFVALHTSAGYALIIFCLFAATVCVREEWTFLYCFMPLQTFASHVIRRGIVRHSCVQSPHWRRVTGWRPTDISTHLVGLCSYIKLYIALSLTLTKDYKIVTYLQNTCYLPTFMC